MKKYLAVFFWIFASISLFCEENSTDLDFIYQIIKENHPGVYSESDPNFTLNLEKSYQIAKNSSALEKEQINTFIASFEDNHLGVSWNDQTKAHVFRKFDFQYQIFNDLLYVELPSFYQLSNKNLKQLKKIESVLENAKYKKIIFDLRNNRGGNSEYGLRLISALFGKEFVQHKINLATQNMVCFWRATKQHIEHLKELKQSLNISFLDEVIQGLEKAVHDQKPFYKEVTLKVSSQLEDTPTFPAIVILIDKNNASAALDFIDYMKYVTNDVLLIGETTKSDRLYMEIRELPLPSNKGKFFYPIKVYQNRPRGDKQPYIPNIFLDLNSFTEGELLNYLKELS